MPREGVHHRGPPTVFAARAVLQTTMSGVAAGSVRAQGWTRYRIDLGGCGGMNLEREGGERSRGLQEPDSEILSTG
jgi:hypothetical protein